MGRQEDNPVDGIELAKGIPIANRPLRGEHAAPAVHFSSLHMCFGLGSGILAISAGQSYWQKGGRVAHHTFTGAETLDSEIHAAVHALNQERSVDLLVNWRISA